MQVARELSQQGILQHLMRWSSDEQMVPQLPADCNPSPSILPPAEGMVFWCLQAFHASKHCALFKEMPCNLSDSVLGQRSLQAKLHRLYCLVQRPHRQNGQRMLIRPLRSIRRLKVTHPHGVSLLCHHHSADRFTR